MLSTTGSERLDAIGADSVCRSPLCGIALPDFETRAPTMTSGNFESFIAGIMLMLSSSVTVSRQLARLEALDRERHRRAARGAREDEQRRVGVELVLELRIERDVDGQSRRCCRFARSRRRTGRFRRRIGRSDVRRRADGAGASSGSGGSRPSRRASASAISLRTLRATSESGESIGSSVFQVAIAVDVVLALVVADAEQPERALVLRILLQHVFEQLARLALEAMPRRRERERLRVLDGEVGVIGRVLVRLLERIARFVDAIQSPDTRDRAAPSLADHPVAA